MGIRKVTVNNFRSIRAVDDLELGPLTVLIGRNNSGKSALLRAMYLAQAGVNFQSGDVRLRTGGPIVVDMTVAGGQYPGSISEHWSPTWGTMPDDIRIRVDANARSIDVKLVWRIAQASDLSENRLPGGLSANRPGHLFVPILSRRRSGAYDQTINRERTATVHPSDSNLAASISSLSGEYAEGVKFRRLIKSVFDLDRIDLFAAENGQSPGIAISSSEGIELERMGEGVSGALKILSEIALAGDHVFLVEEPENDLHPEALRRLLDAMIEATVDGASQFIVSTHSDLVLRMLGAEPGAVVYRTEMVWKDGLPETSYHLVADAYDRHAALRELGYEESLPAGWLVFEEASAEYFVNNALIPEFAPRLAGLKSVSAQGAGNLARTVDALYRLVLFAHLRDKSLPRAWVIADGGTPGLTAKAKLEERFPTWPPDRFIVLGKTQIEDYYPDRFRDSVSQISQERDKKKQGEMKGELARKVCQWYNKEPESASDELKLSAEEVIAALQTIEAQIGTLFD
ncbi:hypothetical protein GCM10009744_30630 [Kribbella alba]|uniref:ATPase AAA-type core domain-containing protein n=1 Tax=Kribbella alba TaxID=190197 RepID=A0ABP4R9S7_9ACTN